MICELIRTWDIRSADWTQARKRQLTRGFFLNGNQKMLITFSAGVTRRALDEDQSTVIARADQALYEAKATGKNKVIFI